MSAESKLLNMAANMLAGAGLVDEREDARREVAKRLREEVAAAVVAGEGWRKRDLETVALAADMLEERK